MGRRSAHEVMEVSDDRALQLQWFVSLNILNEILDSLCFEHAAYYIHSYTIFIAEQYYSILACSKVILIPRGIADYTVCGLQVISPVLVEIRLVILCGGFGIDHFAWIGRAARLLNEILCWQAAKLIVCLTQIIALFSHKSSSKSVRALFWGTWNNPRDSYFGFQVPVLGLFCGSCREVWGKFFGQFLVPACESSRKRQRIWAQ